MTRAAFFLVLLLALPARAQSARPDGATFSTERVGSVLAAAMEFIVPRSLDPTTPPQIAEWGLRGITALDPALATDVQDGLLRLLAAGEPVFRREAPAEPSARAWAQASADVGLAAWTVSEAVRRAGVQGFIQSFFDEVFNHLDPYSRYVPPGGARGARARGSGEAGVGIRLGGRGGEIIVEEVKFGGEAAASGIRPGDRVLAVDDRPVRGRDARTVSGWIAGEDGTAVSLTLRGRDGRVRTIELEREAVPPETVFAERLGDALVLRISAFGRDTEQRLADELQRGLSAGGRSGGVRGVVFDLRGNRGGLLRQAVAATDVVLSAGPIATTAGRNPQAAHRWAAGGGDGAGGRPIVVLVDGRSASAAEIMAAALSDNGRAVVVGSSTLGKGLVQTIAPLPDGGELYVSWSRVLAPRGWPIQGLGVLPQVCTSLGRDALDRQLAALQRGRPALAQALAAHRAARAPVPAARVVELRGACPAAEGREADLAAARHLLDHPAAYAAALLPGAARTP